MTKGDSRWRLLPDENRTVALLECFDGKEWKPSPMPRRLEIYPSNLMTPGGVDVPQWLADELDKLIPPGGFRYVLYST